MIAIGILMVVIFLVIWLNRCLDAFIHAEEIIKHEQWEEEKMVDCSTHA